MRAGFTRGHLLEVVVHVPFDVEGDDESLQVAAEVYLETRLGDQLMDRWIANVSIARIARTRGLLVLSDASDQADNYPLEQTDAIIFRCRSCVRASCPAANCSVTPTHTPGQPSKFHSLRALRWGTVPLPPPWSLKLSRLH